MTISEMQRQAIINDLDNGFTQSDIAMRMGVSLRTVKYISAELKELHHTPKKKKQGAKVQIQSAKVQIQSAKKEKVKKEVEVIEPATLQTYIPSLPNVSRHDYNANRLLEMQLENLETETRLYKQAVTTGDNIAVLHQKNIQKILDTLGKWYGMDNLYAQPKSETITVENDARLEEAKRIIDSDPKLRKAISNDG